jgi:hypothetical protein
MKILEKDFLGSATIGSSNGKEVLAYRRSLDDSISIMVVGDEPFSEEEAWEILFDVYADYDKVEFIEFDCAVANHLQCECAAIFHQYDDEN